MIGSRKERRPERGERVVKVFILFLAQSKVKVKRGVVDLIFCRADEKRMECDDWGRRIV